MKRLGIVDTETTGADANSDRIVTLFYGVMNETGDMVEKHYFLFNPGVPISVEATKVHGISNETAQREGIPVSDHYEIFQGILNLLNRHAHPRFPVVAYNAAFDFTILRNTLQTLGLPGIDENIFVLDPFVLDKHYDTYRSGSRTQQSVATHYGVPVDVNLTHNAEYDCYLAGRITQKLLEKYPEILTYSKTELMQKQALWKKTYNEGLQKFLRKTTNNENLVVPTGWPFYD